MQLKKAISQNIFWRGLYLASSFAVNVLVSRLLSADKVGGIFYTVNNIALFLLITGFSLESGMAYYLAKKQITPFKIALFAVLYSIVAASVCVYLFKYFFAGMIGIIGYDKMLLLLPFAFGTMLTSFFSGLFSALQNFRLPNIVLLVSNFLLMLCLFFFRNTAAFPIHIYHFYFGALGLQGIFLAVTFFIVYRKAQKEKIEKRNNIFGLIFKYSMLAAIANIVYFLLYRVDYWFVNKYCTPGELGNYIQVSKLGQLFLSIPSIIGASVFALVAAQKNENTASNILKVSRTVFGIAVLLMVILLSVGKWLFPFVFGNSFDKMYGAFALLAPGTLAICFLYPLTAYFAGIKMIKVNIIGSSLALVVLLIFDIIFIPKYGILAAAAVSSIGYIVYAFYVTHFFCKQNNIPFTSIFEINKPALNGLLNTKNENIEQ